MTRLREFVRLALQNRRICGWPLIRVAWRESYRGSECCAASGCFSGCDPGNCHCADAAGVPDEAIQPSPWWDDRTADYLARAEKIIDKRLAAKKANP